MEKENNCLCLPAESYIQRRGRLMESIQGPAMVCIFSGQAPMRSLDESYPFSVDRNFYYLTGLSQENMLLVLKKSHAGQVTQSLYIPPYDEVLAKWVGGRIRAAEATEISGIDTVLDIGDFHDHLNGLIQRGRGLGKFRVYLDLWRHREDQPDTPAHTLAARLRNRYPAVEIEDIFGVMAGLRSRKDPRELALMGAAQEHTRVAIEAMLRHAKPGMNESELEGAFDFALMKQGIRQHAFPSIVAGGRRATTLHYGENNQPVQDGELVLIDLGSAYGNYCADISRTFPINGTFSPRQKALYNAVLQAQELVFAAARPGVTLGQLNQIVLDHYESVLPSLGLSGNVREYYYHSVSHQLGLDTHDICTERERTLACGMVITVEPGLYVEDEGIGIRIENDILITQEGCVDLSAAIPRTVDEIEAVMAQ